MGKLSRCAQCSCTSHKLGQNLPIKNACSKRPGRRSSLRRQEGFLPAAGMLPLLSRPDDELAAAQHSLVGREAEVQFRGGHQVRVEAAQGCLESLAVAPHREQLIQLRRGAPATRCRHMAGCCDLVLDLISRPARLLANLKPSRLVSC